MSSDRASRGRTGRPSAAAPLFAALAAPHRLSLVTKLSARSPQSITELADGAAITRQAITKHLHQLEKAGIVRRARRGRETLYSFAPAGIDTVRSYLDRISAQWDRALARLKAYVEK